MAQSTWRWVKNRSIQTEGLMEYIVQIYWSSNEPTKKTSNNNFFLTREKEEKDYNSYTKMYCGDLSSKHSIIWNLKQNSTTSVFLLTVAESITGQKRQSDCKNRDIQRTVSNKNTTQIWRNAEHAHTNTHTQTHTHTQHLHTHTTHTHTHTHTQRVKQRVKTDTDASFVNL